MTTHHYDPPVAFHRHNTPCKECGKTARHSNHDLSKGEASSPAPRYRRTPTRFRLNVAETKALLAEGFHLTASDGEIWFPAEVARKAGAVGNIISRAAFDHLRANDLIAVDPARSKDTGRRDGTSYTTWVAKGGAK